MVNKKNILVLSQAKITLTETFIRVHILNLNANVSHLYGWDLDFKTKDDVPLKELYKPKKSLLGKLKSLLPHYFYFRIKQRERANFNKEALIKRYLKEHHIDAVLAEYGTTGSFIAPICKILNIPLIVHFHGFDASRYDVLERYRASYQLMFQVAQHIIVVSNAMSKTLKQLGCPKRKLVLNTYGPHSDYVNLNVDYHSDYLVAVGRHTYKKAPYLTILAFQKVLKTQPHLKLKMIGDGELFSVSKNLVKSLGLENKVILLGGLERKEIINHLQTSFLFIQHSIVAYNGDSEGTPVGIIEAMAAGLPVVSTRHAGIPDVVIENETGFLVDENDIDEMAQFMLKLAQNREMAKAMGQKGNKRITSDYTVEKHLETINKLIYGI